MPVSIEIPWLLEISRARNARNLNRLIPDLFIFRKNKTSRNTCSKFLHIKLRSFLITLGSTLPQEPKKTKHLFFWSFRYCTHEWSARFRQGPTFSSMDFKLSRNHLFEGNSWNYRWKLIWDWKFSLHPPRLTAGTWKWWFGRCFSFSRGVFSGSMLIFPGVHGCCQDSKQPVCKMNRLLTTVNKGSGPPQGIAFRVSTRAYLDI